MTEPVKKLTNFVSAKDNSMFFGGVELLNRNEVAHLKKTEKNGKKHYIVTLKKGVKIEYPEQKSTNRATIFAKTNDNERGQETYTNITALAEGNITGSKAKDIIQLNGCKNSLVNVSNDDKKDKVVIKDNILDGKIINPSKFNSVFQDNKDVTECYSNGRKELRNQPYFFEETR